MLNVQFNWGYELQEPTENFTLQDFDECIPDDEEVDE